MKIKTSELTLAALDWATCLAVGMFETYPGLKVGRTFLRRHQTMTSSYYIHPSTDWANGGPIIEREGIAIWRGRNGWFANWPEGTSYSGRSNYIDVDDLISENGGPTPLIAAMRCFVASRLGDEVDIPKELL